MRIAVDVGYGFTKAVSQNGQTAIFPSLVAPAVEDNLRGLAYRALPYQVTVNAEEWFVGERARQCLSATALPGQTEKNGKVHDLLLLTAAVLVGAGRDDARGDDLAVGLPLAYFQAQRVSLRDHLAKLQAWVSLEGQPARWVRFEKVTVLPQGAGALALAGELPRRGMVLVLDIGTYTSEYLLFELKQGQPVPVPDACSSVELGCHAVQLALAAEWQARTGTPLPVRMYQEVMDMAALGQAVVCDGKKLDLTPAYQRAVNQTVLAIASAVKAALGDRARYLASVLAMGGGARVFGPRLGVEFPTLRILDDSIFANARGYLALM